ncbi:MAG: hypothetical protein PHF86_07545 [Candidatus Nanoarchaeia archaeon]|jgi:hypothetical protein|nr:hypothetical protein [Candidatus Nanoarchaeia archaeon]
MSTKSDLLSEIASFYDYIGTEFEVVSSDYHVPLFIKNYSVIVYETGLSEYNKKPVLRSKYVDFIVYNEGEVDEAAYYSENELKNDVDSDVTGDNSLASIHKMYISESIRGRVQAAVAKSAQDVLNESIPFSLLTSDANTGQKNIEVASGSVFWIGKTLFLYDSVNSEEVTIANINSNILTMTQDLTNSYTVSNGATARFLNNNERLQWAANALSNPDAYTAAMTSLVSLNPTIQTSGGLASDNDIIFVVNSYINKVAIASYV